MLLTISRYSCSNIHLYTKNRYNKCTLGAKLLRYFFFFFFYHIRFHQLYELFSNRCSFRCLEEIFICSILFLVLIRTRLTDDRVYAGPPSMTKRSFLRSFSFRLAVSGEHVSLGICTLYWGHVSFLTLQIHEPQPCEPMEGKWAELWRLFSVK